jgi:tRNA pseudouridine38-40 synthase
MPTYRLDLEYDGTKFAGWQVQASGRTVQGVLLEALRGAVGQRDLDLQGAGRTDAGVHALGQVASLRTRRAIEPHRLLGELERALPADLAVLDLRPAHPRFHARHDAVARVYRYQITRRRSAFGKRTTWWVPEPLDVRRIAVAARAFEGRHDFRAFARRAGETESTIVEVAACRVATLGEFTLVRVVGSHFLWNQVRRMVAALVAIGRGEAGPDDVPDWLDGRAAPPAGAAPAAGLFLEAVRYAGEAAELPPLVPVGPPLPAGRGASLAAGVH